MAPKRKLSANAPPRSRLSKLAREHKITAEEESEIREAFSLFSEPLEGEKDGVLPMTDLRSALVALGIPPKNKAELADFTSILDPDDDGFASFEPFIAVCALKLHTRDDDADANGRELDEAFRLFTAAGAGHAIPSAGEPRITMAHLKRVATLLKEDVSEDVLRDMILEANGGTGVSRGVARDQFDAVMRRAGVWK